MSNPTSSSSPASTGAALRRSGLWVWLVVAGAFLAGVAVGLERPSLPAVLVMVAAVAIVAGAYVGSRRAGRPTPTRLRPLGLSAVFSVKLNGGPLTVGRSEECDVTLPLETVSSRHCRLFRKRASWFVEDLGSRNGTRVNGKPVRTRRLQPGDTLSIADFEFRVS